MAPTSVYLIYLLSLTEIASVCFYASAENINCVTRPSAEEKLAVASKLAATVVIAQVLSCDMDHILVVSEQQR